MASLTALSLSAFRNYAHARLDALDPHFVILTGPNGSGKTNILEAVSLLTPGRGLRTAEMGEIQNRDHPSSLWAVSAQVQTDFGVIQIGTGRDAHKSKRVTRIQGVTAKSQAELADYVACLWLTPQMDRLFLDGASVRRKFLDRLVFTYDPSHAGRITRYERAMQERLKLLKEKRFDPTWLHALEMQMAESGVAIAAARNDVVMRLSHAQERGISHGFPHAHLSMMGSVEQSLQINTAAQAEQEFRDLLSSARLADSEDGVTHHGIHRSDLKVVFRVTNMPAAACSTGEQKALLIGIILSHAILMKAELGRVPILLLDEIMAHLDEGRRTDLLAVLMDLGGQVFITATENAGFHSLQNGQFWRVENGQISSDFSDQKSIKSA